MSATITDRYIRLATGNVGIARADIKLDLERRWARFEAGESFKKRELSE